MLIVGAALSAISRSLVCVIIPEGMPKPSTSVDCCQADLHSDFNSSPASNLASDEFDEEPPSLLSEPYPDTISKYFPCY